MPKYHNRKTVLDGMTFDSAAEAARWRELTLLEKAGHIRDLQRQVPIELVPGARLHAEAARLRALGYEVSNPAEINPDPTTPWTDCMFRDLRELTECDGIAMLPGWEESPGACIERLWSIRTGKKVLAAGEIVGALA